MPTEHSFLQTETRSLSAGCGSALCSLTLGPAAAVRRGAPKAASLSSSLEPVDMTIFGKRVFADVISAEHLEARAAGRPAAGQLCQQAVRLRG